MLQAVARSGYRHDELAVIFRGGAILRSIVLWLRSELGDTPCPASGRAERDPVTAISDKSLSLCRTSTRPTQRSASDTSAYRSSPSTLTPTDLCRPSLTGPGSIRAAAAGKINGSIQEADMCILRRYGGGVPERC